MNILSLIYCEALKVRKSKVFWVVVGAFTVLPGLALIKYVGSADVTWSTYLSDVLATFTSLLVLGFGFTTCWIFGREYTDGTINELLVKPISKLSLATAKFIVLCLWNGLLTAIMFLVVLLIGAIVGLHGGSVAIIASHFLVFAAASLLVMLVSTVSALMANVTKGYLAPIGLIFMIAVTMNVVSNVGLSALVPWTIPGLFVADGAIGLTSLVIVAATGIAGFAGTVAWWRFVEQQ
jgi:ABC-2 type transport system permease protein